LRFFGKIILKILSAMAVFSGVTLISITLQTRTIPRAKPLVRTDNRVRAQGRNRQGCCYPGGGTSCRGNDGRTGTHRGGCVWLHCQRWSSRVSAAMYDPLAETPAHQKNARPGRAGKHYQRRMVATDTAVAPGIAMPNMGRRFRKALRCLPGTPATMWTPGCSARVVPGQTSQSSRSFIQPPRASTASVRCS